VVLFLFRPVPSLPLQTRAFSSSLDPWLLFRGAGLDYPGAAVSMGVMIRNPDILARTPVFRGTRVPIQALLDHFEGGDPLEDFPEGFPTVSREAAVAALEEAPLKKRKTCSSHAPKCASSSRNAWMSDFERTTFYCVHLALPRNGSRV
jgi:uncharacterized protein (DUF433 family)